MRFARLWFTSAVLLSCLFPRFAAKAQDGAVALRLEEEKICFHLLPTPQLEFPVVNSSQKPISGKFSIELLNSDDKVGASLSGTFIEQPGETTEKIDWPADHLPSHSPSELGWYRLHYKFVPNSESSAPQSEGIVQLGQIITDGFDITVAAAKDVVPGTRYPVRVHVDNPTTNHAYAGIPVDVKLEIGENGDTAVIQKIKTDATGNATAIFELPEKPFDEKGKVTASLIRGPFSEHASLDFEFPDEDETRSILTTDKPLYQPGQTVHVRVLANGLDKRVKADAKLDLTIENEEGEEQFHQKLTASRFGIASADWEIPKKIRLGDYRLKAEIDSEKSSFGSDAWGSIRISRYELPTFTVSAEPDRTYYTPTQNAVVDVHADYLFGKPVQHGKVRIVRQENRHWDFKEQKWVVDESKPVEGKLGPDDHFKGNISLAEEFAKLTGDDPGSYNDVDFAAYVTDSSTGRTEQRRFRIRVSALPIHLYVLGLGYTSRAEPIRFYVTSYYADGTPASVNGNIFAAQPTNDEKWEYGFDLTQRTPLGHFHTNRYGIARVDLPPLAENMLRGPQPRRQRFYYCCEPDGEPAERRALLQFEASDSKALQGKYDEDVKIDLGREYLHVQADHTLYHPGDSIGVTIISNTKLQHAIVDIWSEKGLLSSQATRLSHGRASVTVPYDPRFKGEVYISAICLTESEDDESTLEDIKRVIYPVKRELDVKVKMPRTTYRPGEDASADLNVRTPEGQPIESALGVLVFDQSVAERVRADEDFQGQYGFSLFDYFNIDYWQGIGGVSHRDLLDLDATQPFPEGLDLVAEGMEGNDRSELIESEINRSKWNAQGAAGIFTKWLHEKLLPTHQALDDWYKAKAEYPRDEAEVRQALKAKGIDFNDVRDPWGQKFRVALSYKRAYAVLSVLSNGVDKQAGTSDDFTVDTFSSPYFSKTGFQMDFACQEYLSRTGKYIRDYPTLRDEMKNRGIDLDILRDPWGHAYAFDFDISGPYYRILVTSAGKDGIFDSKEKPSWDDVDEWTSSTHYFSIEEDALTKALAEHFASTGAFPQNEEQLKPILATAKLTPDRLVDPWGHPYRFTFSEKSQYADSVQYHDVRSYSDTSGQIRKAMEMTPVTQQVAFLHILSNGPENNPQSIFSVAEFSRVVAEQSSKDTKAIPTNKQVPLKGGTGALTGAAFDQTGAVIPIAEVMVISDEPSANLAARTNGDGIYTFTDLPTGIYQIECSAKGFVTSIVKQVPVQAGLTTRVDFALRVGDAVQTVTVEAHSDMTPVDSAALSNRAGGAPGTSQAEKPLFTPRLRQYFPETLVWSPEVITDKRGHAHIKFTMADNITAWKMSVIASTESGQVGLAEKELRSFQPFFIEHDPPKVLTVGDRISLPVVLRNYTDQPQTILTELQPAPWFTILSAAQQRLTVEPNGDANSVFTFRADTSAKSAKQRVTARNGVTGDAVERELVVHPNGQEISFSTSSVLAGSRNALEIQVPENAIRGSVDSELRIYPNLTAHVLDAMKGIGARPIGCAEQITSSAYVSLMALELLKKAGQNQPGPNNPRSETAASARDAVQEAYEQLIGLQNPDGGFKYWKDLQSDTPLTAYVLRFLNAAQGFVAVDASVLRKARSFLIAHQTKSGAWATYRWDYGTRVETEVDDPNLTSYVARALAETKQDSKDKDYEKDSQQVENSIKLALNYLEAQIDSWSDAYLAGNYAIAAMESGRSEHVEDAQSLLVRLAHREGATMYWNLEANTSPFYGWGAAGRVETTAVAVEALAMLQAQHPDHDTADMVGRGLEYLLTHKDRYAMWYSTQATENALETMIAAMPPGVEGTEASEGTIMVNGHAIRTVNLPKPTEVVGPITVSLADALEKGTDKVEIVRPGKAPAINATVVTSYYIPWSESQATNEESFRSGETRALRLKVAFDHNDPKMGEYVHCTVGTERIGFRGYGMMLAEVALPPGAEVDRSSIEDSLKYEVQPDRIVFYLWPKAGGMEFGFNFRMRYRMEAMTAGSTLNDYYNPESKAVVAPVRFTVH